MEKKNEKNGVEQTENDKQNVQINEEQLEENNHIKIQISDKFKDIIETVEVINLIYKGETQKIERPINNIGNYSESINTINECITEGTVILNNLKKIKQNESETDIDFEVWAELCSSIMSIVKKSYSKYEDISNWNSQKRLELAIIVTYEIIFNHYYVLYCNDNLEEKDQKFIHYIFSQEGRLALKCVCNATVALFNEIDENNDGEISCQELKKCCCTPSKWFSVFTACIPKKKNNLNN